MESQQHPDRYSFSTLIEQDLNQCFPLTQPFEGLNGSTRETIRSILHAYAYYNPSVGYTEGMCLLVGLLLTHLHMEDAFWLLDGIVQGYGLDRIYSGAELVMCWMPDGIRQPGDPTAFSEDIQDDC